LARVDETSGEPVFNYGSEFSIAADKELIENRVYGALNIIYDPEATQSLSTLLWQREATLGMFASFTTQVRPGIFVGAEARYLRRYEGLGFDPFAGEALFAGPTMYVTLAKISPFRLPGTFKSPAMPSMRRLRRPQEFRAPSGKTTVDVQLLIPDARRGEAIVSVANPSEMTNDRTALIQRAFRLEYVTLAWMTIEAAVAIGAGVAAGSLALTAFGIDSLIELASAIVLVWRLNVELRHGQAFAETAERTASRIGGALLFALAAYVIVSAGWKFWMQRGAEFSVPGLIITVLAIPVMYVLSRSKLQVADALGSRAMRADAVESITCGWLALVVVAALVAQLVTGAWWVDPLASLGVVWFVIGEGREAWEGEDCCDQHCK
jgi:hypothetical protein